MKAARVIAAILLVTMSVAIAGCSGADSEPESQIANLERELSQTRSTVAALEDRIQELESRIDSQIADTVQMGKVYNAWIPGVGIGYTKIQITERPEPYRPPPKN